MDLRMKDNLVDAALDEALSSTKSKLVSLMEEEILQAVQFEIPIHVKSAVKNWMSKNIHEKIDEILTGREEMIISAIQEAADPIGDILKDALVAEMKEKFSEGYKRREVFTVLFGSKRI